jgi:hypothetical protein
MAANISIERPGRNERGRAKVNQSNRSQFEGCEQVGKERAIAFFSDSNQQEVIRLTVCDQHYYAMLETNGPEWKWLKTFRRDLK